MPYDPIENYAMIGGLHTITLVSAAHFDTPSVFGRMLGDDKRSHFSVKPADEPRKRRRIIRRIRVERGSVTFRVDCLPARDFARASREMRGGRRLGVSRRRDTLRLRPGVHGPLTIAPVADLGPSLRLFPVTET